MSTDSPGGSQPTKLDPKVDFVAGNIAGIAALIVGHPFDTVKVRFQNPTTAGRYSSTVGAITQIVREEKVRGLYKGVWSPMAGAAFLNGLVFASYGFLMRAQVSNDSDEPTLPQIFLAGAGSGIIASIITCPTELIKVRQQGMLSATKIPSTTQIALSIFRERGIRGLYRGITATALRDCGYGAYFFTYEGMCRLLRPPSRSSSEVDAHRVNYASLIDEAEGELAQLSWPSLLLAGGLAGVMGWATTFGFDVVKTRMQSTDWYPERPATKPHTHIVRIPVSRILPLRGVSTNIERHPYRTVVSTIVHSYRTEGIRTFFNGLSPTLLRAIPVNMVTFGAFELVVKALA